MRGNGSPPRREHAPPGPACVPPSSWRDRPAHRHHGDTGRFVEEFGPAGRGLVLAGGVDEAEAPYVASRLASAGLDPATFVVCRPDLEGELLRAVGRAGVEGVLDGLGDTASFARFRRQPAQRDRPWDAQVHRFLGTRAGRKVAAARALAAAVPLGRVPAPLARVLGA